MVFSGGQDSTTCLLWALQNFEEVETVTFHYNQRHQEEIDVAKSIAEKLGVKNHLLDMSLLNQLAPNALTRDDIEIEAKDGELPTTFVPGRNLVFLSFASILAYQIGARHIITGVCETDFSGYRTAVTSLSNPAMSPSTWRWKSRSSFIRRLCG